MLAGQIEDQKLWVAELESALDKMAEDLNFNNQTELDRFEHHRTIWVEAKAVLEDYRKGLWCIMHAEGWDLGPSDRRTPELFVNQK